MDYKPNTLIIYPSPTKELNINEKQFITINNYINSDDILLVEDTRLDNLENYKNIKNIVVLLDNYGKFIEKNINFIKNNRTIKFYIHENDLNKNNSKLNAYNRYMLLRSCLKELDHVYILAYYWYYYKNMYDINEKNLIKFPRFIMKNHILEIKKDVKPKILLSGSITNNYYPIRKYVSELNHPSIDRLPRGENITGENYINYLSEYLCCFTCCLTKETPYIINKFFEIPASGSLLLAYDEWVKDGLKEIGFIDGENYISCNKDNILEKIEWICDDRNRNEVDRIRKNGNELVKNNHTDECRYKFILSII
jgi:hypothetical protein